MHIFIILGNIDELRLKAMDFRDTMYDRENKHQKQLSAVRKNAMKKIQNLSEMVMVLKEKNLLDQNAALEFSNLYGKFMEYIQ